MHSKQFLLQMIAYNESISRISDIIQNVSFKSGYNLTILRLQDKNEQMNTDRSL